MESNGMVKWIVNVMEGGDHGLIDVTLWHLCAATEKNYKQHCSGMLV
jgi:hypothetical protein